MLFLSPLWWLVVAWFVYNKILYHKSSGMYVFLTPTPTPPPPPCLLWHQKHTKPLPAEGNLIWRLRFALGMCFGARVPNAVSWPSLTWQLFREHAPRCHPQCSFLWVPWEWPVEVTVPFMSWVCLITLALLHLGGTRVFTSRQDDMLGIYKVHPPLSTKTQAVIRCMENRVAIIPEIKKEKERGESKWVNHQV